MSFVFISEIITVGEEKFVNMLFCEQPAML